MNQLSITEHLSAMRAFYHAGTTHPLEFRIAQLKRLKEALQKHEEAIFAALHEDLRKSREEAYGTEIGLVIAEINNTLKNLRTWLRPLRANTNLANFPSGSRIYRDPLGVVLIIAPWNYPLQLLLVPLVGAIAGGNCAVLKPSEVAPATSAIAEKLITETFDPTYIKIVTGDGGRVVPTLMEGYRFDHVFYTGSVGIGKKIYKLAAEKLVPVTLELGGKSPAIVDKDANVAVAARRIAFGKFLNAGQTCIAPDYVLVQQDVKDEFVNKLEESITQFYSSNPASSDDYGKIINETRFDTLTSYLENAKVIHGGKHDRKSLFIEPTIIDATPDFSNPLWRDEIFGPILPVAGYSNYAEARSWVERNPNPLAFYVFTSSRKTEEQWIEDVAFGGGCVNNTAWHFANHHIPFGGVGNSGIGSYHGKGTFETFTRAKPMMKTPTWLDPSFKYPPFKGKMKLFKWFIR